MSDHQLDETRDFWNRAADDWLIQVGEDGDRNRILNSDPVLWRFVGEVAGRKVLDAGCGTGYLSRKLLDRGARVTGVDLSERMIEIARRETPDLDFRVDSCSQLSSIGDDEFDILVSNYVLMDTPDLEGTMAAFHRVLKAAGAAVLVFSHPCFNQGAARVHESGTGFNYSWTFSYFERRKCVDPPWHHFTTEFIWFHRPLSDYWKAFQAAGFAVVDFEEPRLTEDRFHLIEAQPHLDNCRTRPYSVAFKLQKQGERAEK